MCPEPLLVDARLSAKRFIHFLVTCFCLATEQGIPNQQNLTSFTKFKPGLLLNVLESKKNEHYSLSDLNINLTGNLAA